jgi:hypothetical protein
MRTASWGLHVCQSERESIRSPAASHRLALVCVLELVAGFGGFCVTEALRTLTDNTEHKGTKTYTAHQQAAPMLSPSEGPHESSFHVVTCTQHATS